MRYSFFYIIALMLFLFSPSPALTEPLKIAGTLQQDPAMEGCSCRLDLGAKPGALVYTSDMNGDKARMNLYEADVDLKKTGASVPAEPKKNQPYLLEYEHDSVTVSMVCLPKPCSGKGCEGFGVSATVTILDGNTKDRFMAEGRCGCSRSEEKEPS